MYTRRRSETPLQIPKQYGGTAFSDSMTEEAPERTYMPRKTAAPPGFPRHERPSPPPEDPPRQNELPAEDVQNEEAAVPVCESVEEEAPPAIAHVAPPEAAEAHQESFLGREELLLLVLALLMLGEDGGDSMLGYLLLGMMFLK